ncbi:MAG TPA: hypothetical protein VMB18_12985 [Terriglobales bacterium]|nr:hypothetical protein [Terriglobales bacterium]
MKKFLFATAVMLLCSSFGWAQQQSDQSMGSGSQAQVGTVRGCLGGTDGGYTLTQDQSGTMFRLVGNDDQLKSHMGQEVLVTGQLPPAAPAPSAAGENSSSGSSTSGNVIQVSDVRVVSKTCASGNAAPSSY